MRIRFRIWLLVAIGLFGMGLAAGITAPYEVTDTVATEYNALGLLVDFIGSLPPVVGGLVILLKNALALFISFFFSPLLCLMPVITLLVNGWLIGYVAVVAAQQESFAYVLAGLLPHGILEFPAFIIGEAAALSFGMAFILTIFKKDKEESLVSLKKNLKYLGLAMLLLVPAAFIEMFITPLFLK